MRKISRWLAAFFAVLLLVFGAGSAQQALAAPEVGTLSYDCSDTYSSLELSGSGWEAGSVIEVTSDAGVSLKIGLKQYVTTMAANLPYSTYLPASKKAVFTASYYGTTSPSVSVAVDCSGSIPVVPTGSANYSVKDTTLTLREPTNIAPSGAIWSYAVDGVPIDIGESIVAVGDHTLTLTVNNVVTDTEVFTASDPVKPTQPADQVVYGNWADSTGTGVINCTAGTVSQSRSVTTTPYVWNGTVWVLGDMTTTTTETRPRQLTAAEKQASCEPTVIRVAIPAAPAILDDSAVQGDAHYVVPSDTESLTWSKNADGSVVVSTNTGYEFTDGTTSKTYPAPVDQYTPPVNPSSPASSSASSSSEATSLPASSATSSVPTTSAAPTATGTETESTAPSTTASAVLPAETSTSSASPSLAEASEESSSAEPSGLPHTGEQGSLVGTIVSGLFLVSALGGGAALVVARKKH